MAGRPKMTDKQKADAKAAREAAKVAATAGAGAAADRAEARSTSPKPPPPAAAKAQSTQNTDDLDREEKALFLHHMPLIKVAKEALNTANSNLRNLYKKAKAEGNFTKADFDTAFALETAEKEARERAKIARQLKIAKIVGSSLGGQLDLFLEPDRTPAVDRAREEGERASMEGKSAQPPYDPSTPQYRTWLDGHASHQASLAAGFKKLHPAVAEDVAATADQKAKVDKQKDEDAKDFDIPAAEPAKEAQPEAPNAAPQSGVPMTRAQFKASQEAARRAAEGGKPN